MREFPAGRRKWKKKEIVFDDLPSRGSNIRGQRRNRGGSTPGGKGIHRVVEVTITVVNPAINGYLGGNAWTIAKIIAEKTYRKTSPVRRIVNRKKEEKQHEKNRITSKGLAATAAKWACKKASNMIGFYFVSK